MAIDFYIDHPQFISLFVKSDQIEDDSLMNEIKYFFYRLFWGLFGNMEETVLRFEKDKIIDILIWRLMKTRNDFLVEIKENNNIDQIRENYHQEWIFLKDLLKSGIYK